MTEQEYLNGISSRSDDDYPAVVQVSDPLLVRVSKTSLLLNDTTFYAKIKKGLAFNGYVIYSSGIGTPIIEVDIGSTPETTGTGTVTNKTENDVDIAEIEQAASEFLDKLEARIATSEFQNPIKASIDRLCWQLHYDITKSKTNFVTAFEDQGFAKIVTSVDGWSSSSTTDGATFYDYFADLDTSIGTDSTGLIGATKQIATSLRADDNEFTISKALRDADDGTNVKCVSWSVKEQTDLERVQFLDISENRLGSFGTSMDEDPTTHQPLYTHRSLFDSMNGASSGYSITTDKRLNEVLGSVQSNDQTYTKSVIEYDNEISITKLGDFGGRIPGGSSHYRSLFETFNKETTVGDNKVYRGPSHIWDKTICDTVGGTADSTETRDAEKMSVYTRLKKVVSDTEATDTNVTGSILGRIGNSNDSIQTSTTVFAKLNKVDDTTSDIKTTVDSTQTAVDSTQTAVVRVDTNVSDIKTTVGNMGQSDGYNSVCGIIKKFDYSFYRHNAAPQGAALIRSGASSGSTPCLVAWAADQQWHW